ncbi:hypothetical protein BJ958_004301 [Nocardioides kongjuensis]|uniref:RNA polymerase sigma factor 70 region 4 type 2 domain-containing protein n=2 Tax=Nocardioides kongjuensis TaxID=349522 RepID=A0A852RP26_9ACTN|nr:hypothetical protein [Nocardioides kongjuensis]
MHIDNLRRLKNEALVGDDATPDQPVADGAEGRAENAMVLAALSELPDQFRAALWYAEVVGLPYAEIAERMDSNANAVGVLLHRAREALRRSYLSVHVKAAPGPECQGPLADVARFVRGDLPARREAKLLEHLDGCGSCTAAAQTVRELNTNLGALLVPAVGAGGLMLSKTSKGSGHAAAKSKTPALVAGTVATGVLAAILALVFRAGDPPAETATTVATSTPTTSPAAPNSLAPTPPVVPVVTPSVVPPSPPPTVAPAATPTPTAAPAPQPRLAVSQPRLSRATSGNVTAVRVSLAIQSSERRIDIVVDVGNSLGLAVGGSRWRCSGGGSSHATCSISATANRTELLALTITPADAANAVSGSVAVTSGGIKSVRRFRG